MNQPLPQDLAGFQLLCSSEIANGDLLVDVDYPKNFRWVEDGDNIAGAHTADSGETPAACFRVYRRLPVPRQEGMTAPTATVHHSDPAPRPNEKWAVEGQPLRINTADGEIQLDPHPLRFDAASGKTVSTLPTTVAARKGIPIATGFVDYFPDAIAEVAKVSKAGNEQHHPGKPLHWDKSKSTDEADALMRHFVDRGTIDTDGQRHSAKVAWRALALLQRELDASRAGGAQ